MLQKVGLISAGFGSVILGDVDAKYASSQGMIWPSPTRPQLDQFGASAYILAIPPCAMITSKATSPHDVRKSAHSLDRCQTGAVLTAVARCFLTIPSFAGHIANRFGWFTTAPAESPILGHYHQSRTRPLSTQEHLSLVSYIIQISIQSAKCRHGPSECHRPPASHMYSISSSAYERR
jgi:hypothetical protein